MIQRYKRSDLLIIDELGYLPIKANSANLISIDKWPLYTPFNNHNNNVPLPSWIASAAQAILGRLV